MPGNIKVTAKVSSALLSYEIIMKELFLFVILKYSMSKYQNSAVKISVSLDTEVWLRCQSFLQNSKIVFII